MPPPRMGGNTALVEGTLVYVAESETRELLVYLRLAHYLSPHPEEVGEAH